MQFPASLAGRPHSAASSLTRTPTAEASHQAAPSKTAKSKLDAANRFEAMMLQNMLGAMLPKNAQSVFGKGTAGDMWKSMLSQQLAETLAAGHQFGFAKLVTPKTVNSGTDAAIPGTEAAKAVTQP